MKNRTFFETKTTPLALVATQQTMPLVATKNDLADKLKPTVSYKSDIDILVLRARLHIDSNIDNDKKSIAGRRFFGEPHGETEYILAIGQMLSNLGEKKRIMTRRIKMP